MANLSDKEDINIFAKRLRKLIKAKGYTHENVAQGIGVTRQAVGKWVSGDNVPDVLTAANLAEFFNVSVDYLSGKSEITSPDPDLQAACAYLNMSEKVITTIKDLDENQRLCSERDVFICLCENGGLISTTLKSIATCIAFIIENDEKRFALLDEINEEEEIDNNITAEDAADGYGTNYEKLRNLEEQESDLKEQEELAKWSALSKIKGVLDVFADNYADWLW